MYLELLDEELTYAVIGCFRRVFNKLGSGFLENVYVGGLMIELQRAGLHAQREVPIAIYYDADIVGTYRVDILVERRLVLEVKSGVGPEGKFEKQLRNYLRCSDLELGLLLVFDERPIHKRVIHTNRFKPFKASPQSFQSSPRNSAESALPRTEPAPPGTEPAGT